MHPIVRWALPALLATAPLGAGAQTDSPFRIGLGGSLEIAGNAGISGGYHALTFLPAGFADIAVPMWFGNVRLEPHLGWASYRREDSDRLWGNSPTSRMRYRDSVETSAFRFGLGAAYGWEVAERTWLYAGPRFGVVMRSAEFEEPYMVVNEKVLYERTSASAVDLWVGAGVGGEAFLTPAFSLGAEVQLNYVSAEAEGPNRSVVSTAGLVLARVYFN